LEIHTLMLTHILVEIALVNSPVKIGVLVKEEEP